MIEPIALGATDGAGYVYADFGALGPDGYLQLTRRWAQTFLATVWPATYRVRVAMVYDVLFTGLSAGTNLVFTIDRGNIGATTLTVFNMLGPEPVEVLTTTWSGVTTGRNSHDVAVAASSLRSP
jgi:hypothetical protein